MNVIAINIGSAVTFIVLTLLALLYCKHLYYLNKKDQLEYDQQKLELVTKLMPWIHEHLATATQKVLDRYRLLVLSDRIKKTITVAQYNQIIEDIRMQFYGTIPVAFNQNVLFQYVDSKQIDIMILAYYRDLNDIFSLQSN